MGLPTKANVSRPEGWGYDALLEYGDTDAESLYLRLAPGPGRTMRLDSSVSPDNEAPNLSTNPEEMRSESGRSYGRDDFTGGEGLDYAHRRGNDERDASRFWVSSGINIDPPEGGESREIKLLHQTESIRSEDAGGIQRSSLVRIGTTLYAISSNSTQVDITSDPTASSPTFSTESPGGTGDILDLTHVGGELYALHADGNVYKRTTGGSWSNVWSSTFERIWGVKGRLIAARDDGALFSDDDASTVLHTLPSGESWTDAVDAGAAVLVGATDGYIYIFSEENGELVLKGQTLIEGEQISALGYAQGLIFIGTKEPTTAGGAIGRLWRAAFVGIRIREGQVLRKWGDASATVDHSPKRIIGSREAVYTAIRHQDDSETQVWKYHLVTGAVSQNVVQSSDGVSHGLAIVDDRLFFNIDGQGIYREDADDYVSSGYVIGPAADFFTAAKKAWVGARLQTGSVPSDSQVDLYYSTDIAALEDPSHSSWTSIITATNASPGAGVETPITGVESRYLLVKVVLSANTGTSSTPTVLAYSVRGLARSTEEDVPLIINVSDRLEIPGKRPQTINGIGDAVYEKLLDIKAKAVTLTLLRPDKVYKGQLLALSAPIEHIPERGSPTVYCQAVVRGQLQ